MKQAKFMTICRGDEVTEAEVGHWVSKGEYDRVSDELAETRTAIVRCAMAMLQSMGMTGSEADKWWKDQQ